ncbi:MAG: MASE1 domain-containing protein [Limnospira sp.]
MDNRFNLNPKNVSIAAIAAVTYICIAKISLLVATVFGKVAAIWPISGLAIGGALLLGYPVILGVFIGSCILGFFSRELAVVSVITTVSFAVANSVEATVAVVLSDRWIGSRNWFLRAPDLFKFIGLSAVLSPALSATIATFTLMATRQVSWDGGVEIWKNWWVSNAVGILVFTPAIVTWSHQNPDRNQMLKQQKIEFLVLAGLLLAINFLAFWEGYAIEYMLILPLIWAAFRFTPQIVTLLVVVMISTSAIATANGYGPFIQDSPNESLVLLQSFIGAIAISALVLSALVSENKTTQRQLKKINSELEDKIRKRTALLEERNIALKHQNKILSELAGDVELRQGHLDVSIKKLTEACGRTLNVERTSVWLLESDGTHLSCRDLYQLSTHQHQVAPDLYLANYPNYSQALASEQVLLAHDAKNDPRTREFLDSYLIPLNIASMLEIAIRADDQVLGVFCLETVGQMRTWTPEEEGFARSMGDLVSLAFEAHHRRQAETQLRLSQVNLLEAQRVAQVGNWEYDLDTGKITGSEEVFHIFGLIPAREAPELEELKERIYPEDRDAFLAAVERAIDSKKPVQFDYRIVRPDGSIRFAEAKTKPLTDGRGRVTRLFGTLLDITKRKQAEEKIRLSEERYRTLFEGSQDAVMLLDETGFIDCNFATLNIFCCTDKAEFIDKEPSDFSPRQQPDGADSQSRIAEMMQISLRRGMHCFEWQHRRLNGEQFTAEVSLKATTIDDRNVWQVVVRDISDRKAYERQLQQAKTAADAANQAKSEFLANMSHELRTPLNGILGYTQILERAEDLNRHRHGIDIIRQCGSHLLNLINDILDLSKIEARKMELYPKEFHFLSFITSVAEMIRIRAKNKGIEFTYIGDPLLPTAIIADEKRLGQILINLLGNAVKFTDIGGVIFRVEVLNSHSKSVRLRFEVKDTGVGMSEEQIEKIFRPFEQVGAISRRAEGSGLGLTISQKLLAIMGSSIEVSSQLGRGSCFEFNLEVSLADDWATAVTQVEAGKIVGYEGSRRTLLIVDDKAINLTILIEVLNPLGFDCYTAENGEEGLVLARELRPNLILTDLVMPVLDGFEMTRRLRQDPHLKNTIIIASSASVLQQDQVQSWEAGCDDFIPKPIEFDKLLAILQKHLQLEWIYEANLRSRTDEETPQDIPSNEWGVPPTEALMAIYEAAKIGDIEKIEEEAQRIKSLDRNYLSFCDRVLALALNFEDNEIVNLIEAHLPHNSRD